MYQHWDTLFSVTILRSISGICICVSRSLQLCRIVLQLLFTFIIDTITYVRVQLCVSLCKNLHKIVLRNYFIFFIVCNMPNDRALFTLQRSWLAQMTFWSNKLIFYSIALQLRSEEEQMFWVRPVTSEFPWGMNTLPWTQLNVQMTIVKYKRGIYSHI